MLIDTHCHLDFPEFDRDREEVIQRSRQEGIDYIVNIGSSLKGSEQSIELAKRYDFIYATVGLHPHEADRADQAMQNTLSDLAKQDKVVAIGEIGLDYFKNYSNPENQRPLFKSLLGLAKSLNLPVVIHNRQAQGDTLSILKENMPIKAVVHCFSGDENFLNQCLDLGFFVSFTCNITYRKAENLRSLVKLAPMERLMLETDAPFLSPEEHRGRRNEPLYVKSLANKIASIKGISFEEVAKVTTEN
ncbi:MAG: TatD family hydrolase, partial [Candidatus Omnitrophica bacterium]|nr:TatD family hydrolase [Candidatus Omnitrophota bacterium]